MYSRFNNIKTSDLRNLKLDVPTPFLMASPQKKLNKGWFKKGNVPHNKGKTLSDYLTADVIKKIKKTHFKKGNIPPQRLPKGTVSKFVRKSNGEVMWTINIDWRGNRKSHNSYKWYLWEVENQEDRPEGYVLAVKNGDPNDIRLENLELITRAENLRKNRCLIDYSSFD